MPVEAFKVMARTKGGKLVSAVVDGQAQVVYHPRPFWRRWVQAPKSFQEEGYHVCVFLTYRDAERFADLVQFTVKHYGHVAVEVWRVEADELIEVTYLRMTMPKELLDKTPREALYWEDCGVAWPRATRMARRIRLMEQVRQITWKED